MYLLVNPMKLTPISASQSHRLSSKDIQFTARWNGEKQQILTFEKLKPAIVWHFSLIDALNDSLIINIFVVYVSVMNSSTHWLIDNHLIQHKEHFCLNIEVNTGK